MNKTKQIRLPEDILLLSYWLCSSATTELRQQHLTMPSSHIPSPSLVNLVPLVSASVICSVTSLCLHLLPTNHFHLSFQSQYPRPFQATYSTALHASSLCFAYNNTHDVLQYVSSTDMPLSIKLIHILLLPFCLCFSLITSLPPFPLLILSAPDLPKAHALHFLPTSTPITAWSSQQLLLKLTPLFHTSFFTLNGTPLSLYLYWHCLRPF